jgi:archaetidylinositol phosphate synthase
MSSQLALRNTSILSGVEAQFIRWMLPKFPNFITPDILTVAATLSGFLIAVFYYLSTLNKYFLFLVSFAVILHWFADSHDGGLACYRGVARPNYGHYTDHISDIIVTFLMFYGLFLYGINLDAIFVLFGAWVILAYHSMLCYQTTGFLQLSFCGVSPTEARIGIILTNIFLYFGFDNFIATSFYLTAALLFIVTCYHITITFIKLNNDDRKKLIK